MNPLIRLLLLCRKAVTYLFSAYSASVVNQVAGGFELINPAGGYGAAQTPIQVTSGATYRITFNFTGGAQVPAGVRVIIGFGSGSPAQANVTNTNGSKSVDIVASVTALANVAIQFIDGGSGKSGTVTGFTFTAL